MDLVSVDKRIKRFVSNITEWENDICSVLLVDIDETFWFNSKSELQEFLNTQSRERVYDKELRNGYFEYTNENNEKIVYNILKLHRGKIIEFETEIKSE